MKIYNKLRALVGKLKEEKVPVERPIYVVSCSVIGKREKNEDHKIPDKQKGIYILADGMGGEKHRQGETCSDLASHLLYTQLKKLYSEIRKEKISADKIPRYLEKLMGYTNDMVTADAHNVDIVRNFGTTLDVCFIFDNVAYMGHVGDGAIFIVNQEENSIEKITKEHVHYPLDIEEFSEIEKQVVAAHGGLTSYIGCGDDIVIDTYERDLSDNNVVVMATDGLTNTVAPEEILEVITTNEVSNIRKRLLERAKNPVVMEEAYEQMRIKGHDVYLNEIKGDNISFIIYGRDTKWS